MKMLHFEETEDTPEVRYDEQAETLLIRGRSLPEDAYTFYQPVLEWAKGLRESGKGTFTIELFLEYFNSSSGRYLLELFLALGDAGIPEKKIVWLVEQDDELMIEKGEEFSLLIQVPFHIQAV
ncbi:MAG: hypothetical protein RL226_1508 [Bacteroidota bacterium]